MALKRYNLFSKFDTKALVTAVRHARRNKLIVQFGVVNQKRTRKQSGYAEVLYAYFAVMIGETKEYVKQYILKQVVNPEIFETEYKNQITGKTRVAWRSTADLDTVEQSLSLTRLKHFASMEYGVYLPEPKEDLSKYENEISKYSNREFI